MKRNDKVRSVSERNPSPQAGAQSATWKRIRVCMRIQHGTAKEQPSAPAHIPLCCAWRMEGNNKAILAKQGKWQAFSLVGEGNLRATDPLPPGWKAGIQQQEGSSSGREKSDTV